MAADERPVDARFVEELTPLPDSFHPGKTNAELELMVAQQTCESQRLALATMQAQLDAKDQQIKQLRDDRRVLAGRVKSLDARLESHTAEINRLRTSK